MSRLAVVLPPGAGGALSPGTGGVPTLHTAHWAWAPQQLGHIDLRISRLMRLGSWAGLGWAGKQIHLAALGGVMDRTAAIY